MSKRLIRVSSRALGYRAVVRVYLYDTLTEMQEAGQAFNGNDLSNSAAITQCYTNSEGRAGIVIVRLAKGYLGTRIVTHEMHHASTALYGAEMGDRLSRRAHLNHWNEEFAHLHSDLCYRLVDRLYALGYYSEPATIGKPDSKEAA